MTQEEIKNVLDIALKQNSEVEGILQAGITRTGTLRTIDVEITSKIIFSPQSVDLDRYHGDVRTIDGRDLGPKYFTPHSFIALSPLK